MASDIMRYFTYKHLPKNLQEVSADVCEIAFAMDVALPDGPEKDAGLRKLLEAKDCFVRASLPIPNDEQIDKKEFNCMGCGLDTDTPGQLCYRCRDLLEASKG